MKGTGLSKDGTSLKYGAHQSPVAIISRAVLSVMGFARIPECRNAQPPEQDDKNQRGGQHDQRALFGKPLASALQRRWYPYNQMLARVTI
jgi:hypothetical protein